MGTWGSGNFESDTALDHLSVLIDRLVTEVAEAMAGDPVELEPDEYWGVAVPCNLELLYVMARAGHGVHQLPETDVITGWKAAFMAVWERTVDDLEPSPGYKDDRRSVLNRTFDQLAEVTAGVGAEESGR
ncbi:MULTISPECIES: DUF4259 domain-containing protein [Streptomycetaceae]|uniref:DUF4259 domain-containing protein n=1 Tax=Streptomycetaceae TaxID=2062 RepID=UPI0009393D07|nr:DUF4259 domain-containing protein [Streptomyces sp. CB02056]OKI02770.1 hypothetical protein AMK13_29465 [Streptomyces sp. CB02056]